MTEVTKKARGRPPARALTKKQKTFAELYVWERGNKNNTQCAFEAGYKTRATKAASDLLNRRMYPLVGKYIDQLEKEQEMRFRINKSIHMQDLGKIKNVSMEQPSTYSVAQRAEENRGKVMGYYKNENINTNVNIQLDNMSKEDLIKEFDSFYQDKMKDVTPIKEQVESEQESNLESD
jgi:phage terminase small subunit|tara:strand:- start:135 stop:668 length:534 start_codon:yes stop_codon:yes gene_type:complete